MALSNELISQFAKLVTKEKKVDNGSIVYGKVIVDEDGQKYVQLDGSTEKTPITEEGDASKMESTADVVDGERVAVMIKNHTATVMGNISSPAARTGDVVEVKRAQIVLAERLQVDEGYIHELQADVADIGELRAATAKIGELEADNVKINETLEAQKAEITDLEAKKIDASVVQATYATIENLEAESAKVGDLEVNFGKFEDATVKDLEAVNADITNLKAKDAEMENLIADKASIGMLEAANAKIATLETKDAEIENLVADKASIGQLNAVDAKFNNLNATYANIDFSNIKMAAVEELFTKSGIIKDLVVGDTSITGELVGVTLKGDLVEAGTLKADKLVVKGSDGIFYKLNVEAGGITASEAPTDSLHGSVITAKSITAEKVSVKDLVAFGATIGGFKITDNSIHSVSKPAVDSGTRGVYLDNEGQVAFGDGTQYLKYYKQADGSYKLVIVANELHIGTKNVETSIKEAKDAADAAQETANNNASDMTEFVKGFNQDIANLQTQIDGSITTWFGEVAPTNTNEPASKWTTADDKNVHLGDLYYDTITGYCYRWQVKNNEYSWQKITDTDVTKALEDASKAQDTADQKRRVFYSQPTAPYDKGDLWVQGSSGDILRCQTAKVAGQSFNASDWVAASKYTDDTKANAAQTAANNAQTAANNAQADIDNLQIGGRNLLKFTQDMPVGTNGGVDGICKYSTNGALDDKGECLRFTFNGSSTAAISIPLTHDGAVDSGETVTLSFKYRGNITNPGSLFLMQRTLPNVSVALAYIGGYLTVNETEWQTYTATFSHAEANDRINYRILMFYGLGDYSTDKWIEIKKGSLKLEKGNRATDWTPAPEDVDDKITTVDDKVTIVETRVTEAETAINQNKEAIELRATKKEVTEQLEYRDPVGTASGSYITLNDVSSVEHDIGLKIRGRTRKSTNLATAQSVYAGAYLYAETVVDGRNCIRFTSGDYVRNTPIAFKPNTQYTISFYAKSENFNGATAGNAAITFYYDDGERTTCYISLEATDWRFYTLTSQSGKTVSQVGVNAVEYRAYVYLDTDTFMFNEGSTALPYEPYFEGLHSDAATVVEDVGANLIDGENKDLVSCYYPISITAGDYIATVRNPDGSLDGIKNGSTYSAMFLDKDDNRIVTGVHNGVTVTDEQARKITRLYIPFSKSYYTGSFTTVTHQLNKGKTALPYTPYQHHSLPIPESIRNINGYGDGLSDELYNYLDWKNKKFIRRVGRVDLGTLSWIQQNTSRFIATNLPYYTKAYNTELKGVGICAPYDVVRWSAVNSLAIDKGLALYKSSVYVSDTAYTDAATFKAAMSGVYLVYELAEPEIIDISSMAEGELRSIHPTTHIFTDCDAVMDVTYNKDNALGDSFGNQASLENRVGETEAGVEQLTDATGSISGKAAVRIDDISSVPHEMSVKLSGKNLYDNSTILDKLAGTSSTGYKMYQINLPNGTYTWSLQEHNFYGSGCYVLFTDDIAYAGNTVADGCFESWIGHSDSTMERYNALTRSFTVTKGYVYLAIVGTIATAIGLCETMQIESGTEATEYEPYVDFSGLVPKKNLYDHSTVFAKTWIESGTGECKTNSQFNSSGYIYISEGMTFTGNYIQYCAFYDANKIYISDIGNKSSSVQRTLTMPDNACYIRFTYKLTITDGSDVQIELGTETTEYEPYQLVPPVNVTTYGKNLLDLSKAVLNNCTYNADINGITSNIANTYFCRLAIYYLNDFLMNNRGKTVTFSTSSPVSSDRVTCAVIWGTFPDSRIVQEVNSAYGENSVSITIDPEFTSINYVELRLNRNRSEAWTDTTSTFADLQLELGTEATEYEPYKQPVTYYANEDGSVDGAMSVHPTTTIISNNPYVTIDCEYNKNTLAGADRSNQAALEKRVKTTETSIAQLAVMSDEISAKVQKNTETITNDLNARLTEVEKTAGLTLTEDEIKATISTTIKENGATKVVTETGYSFTDEGMMVYKSDSEMKTQITDDGMKVFQNDQETLTADNEGVKARNLRASTYLIVGGRSRFQNYEKDGKKRTGCFWIESEVD